MLLDRSGQGKVYNLITRRRFLQMDVLEGLNVLVTISGGFNSGTLVLAIQCVGGICFTSSDSNKHEVEQQQMRKIMCILIRRIAMTAQSQCAAAWVTMPTLSAEKLPRYVAMLALCFNASHLICLSPFAITSHLPSPHQPPGKKNKLRVYYLSWLRNRILHNDPEVEKKQGWITVGDLEGCVHYKVGEDLYNYLPIWGQVVTFNSVFANRLSEYHLWCTFYNDKRCPKCFTMTLKDKTPT